MARAIKHNRKVAAIINHSFKVKIMPIVIYGLGGGHTHTQTHTLAG